MCWGGLAVACLAVSKAGRKIQWSSGGKSGFRVEELVVVDVVVVFHAQGLPR